MKFMMALIFDYFLFTNFKSIEFIHTFGTTPSSFMDRFSLCKTLENNIIRLASVYA